MPSFRSSLFFVVCALATGSLSAQTFRTLQSFELGPAYASASLVLAKDGNLYGVSALGGASNLGTIYKLTPDQKVTIVAEFTGQSGALPGSNPSTALVAGADGNLYGTTKIGGEGFGVAYRMIPGGTAKVLAKFTGTGGTLPGQAPRAPLTLAPNGELYGTTYQGGTGNFGTVFKIDPQGRVRSVMSFSRYDGTVLSGGLPIAPLAVGSDGRLYGTTTQGGIDDLGTVFRIAPGLSPKTLASFTSAFGTLPGGGAEIPLTLAPNGELYGVTRLGGSYNRGTIFRINAKAKVYPVAEFVKDLPGSYPTNPLTVAGDGNLYGTTPTSTTPGSYGLLYKVTPGVGVAAIPSTSFNFSLVNPSSPLFAAQDGNLYGIMAGSTSVYSGSGTEYFQNGAIYKVVPGGKVILRGTPFPLTGTTPSNALVTGADGNLYGAAPPQDASGAKDNGGIFALKLPSASVATIAKFNFPQRIAPYGLTVGKDGNLYGFVFNGVNSDLIQMTPSGQITAQVKLSGQTVGLYHLSTPSGLTVGINGNLWGVMTGYQTSSLFVVTPHSTGKITVRTVKTVAADMGQPVLAPDRNLYGIVLSGNFLSTPAIYQVTPPGVFSLVAPLDASAHSRLTLGADGKLYGTTDHGGDSQQGSLFQFTPGGTTVQTVASFSGTVPDGTTGLFGAAPSDLLTAATDGSLYGTTPGTPYPSIGNTGGVIVIGHQPPPANPAAIDPTLGTVYRYRPGSGASTIFTFGTANPDTTGRNPYGPLVQGKDGSLFGFASLYPSYNTQDMLIYKIDSQGTAKWVDQSIFPAAYLSTPVLGADGELYGTAEGGTGGNHTIFSLDTSAVRPQAITFPAIPKQILTTALIKLTATASSNLPVKYTVDSGPATLEQGPVTLAGAFLKLTGTGTVQVTAWQSGDTRFGAAAPVTRTFQVSNTP